MRSWRLDLDPRTKLVLLVLCSFLSMLLWSPLNYFLVFSAVLLLCLLSGGWSIALRGLLTYVVLWSLQQIGPHLPRPLVMTVAMIGALMQLFLPSFMLAFLLMKTTPASHLAAGLRAWHVPQTVTVPLVLTLRYFPAIGEDWRHIRDAMKLRALKGPLKKVEYTLVPLLVCACNAADELSAAALTRGLDNPAPKTSHRRLHLGGADWVCLILALLISLYVVWRR